MYKVSVPVMISTLQRYGAEDYVKNLKKIKADRIFIAIDSYITDQGRRQKTLSDLEKYCKLLKSEGFEVGVWVWTFMVVGDTKYVHITSPSGKASRDQVCPSDEEFCAFAQEYLSDVAKCGPDMIMFDDDFRYGFLDCGQGCTCKNHRAYMSELLGEELGDGDLSEKLLVGGKNKYRSAWLKANGHYFEEFSKKVREAVDAVDPNIRVGLCACMSAWDFDGISADRISKILAGNTKPFLRLIGAPYWATMKAWGNRLQDVIELERMERSWCEDGIEIFAEGDTFPRPRFRCPSNYLEGFDMALRAADVTDGILKYVCDYYSDTEYESGYIRKHIKNEPVYSQINKHFSGKDACGVRVYEHKNKFENMEIPEEYKGKCDVINTFFSHSARLLAACSIPTVYSGLGSAGIAFGENAKYLDAGALDNGLILDRRGAEILTAQGVDVGLIQTVGKVQALEEYFVKDGQYVSVSSPVQELSISEKAQVESTFIVGQTGGTLLISQKSKEIPASYRYENANGQRFLVFAFDGYFASENLFKHYARAKQLTEAIEWLHGKPLPAFTLGNPDCYMLCKKNDNAMSVWIGNFFADEMMNTEITLDKEYKTVEFIACNGRLEGNKVILDGIAPFASAGFEVKD